MIFEIIGGLLGFAVIVVIIYNIVLAASNSKKGGVKTQMPPPPPYTNRPAGPGPAEVQNDVQRIRNSPETQEIAKAVAEYYNRWSHTKQTAYGYSLFFFRPDGVYFQDLNKIARIFNERHEYPADELVWKYRVPYKTQAGREALIAICSSAIRSSADILFPMETDLESIIFNTESLRPKY